MRDAVKKYTFVFFCTIFLLSFSGVAFAEGERIDAFHVQVTLEPNGSVLVQEEIVYDFGADAEGRHGIYRKVPLVYTIPGERKEHTIEISSIMVTDGEGRLLRSVYSGGGNFMQLQIGEPDVFVSGRQRYVIRYTVWGGINQSFPDKDEFYWNATGNGWDVPIGIVRADAILPVPLQENKISTACYVGHAGSTMRCSASSTPQEGTGVVNSVRFTYDKSLLRNEGMTIAVGIPKGIYVIAPLQNVKTLAKSVGLYRWWKKDYLGFSALIPLIVFTVMLRLWWKRGRDPKGSGVIITHYEVPEHLSVLDVAYLHHNNLRPVAVSAALVDFAIRGLLTIERVTEKILFIETEDFRITFTKNSEKIPLSPIEKILFDDLRTHGDTVLVSALAHKMTAVSSKLGSMLATTLTERGYYAENPRTQLLHYALTGAAAIVLGFFLPFGNFALVTSGIIVILFATIMPKRTAHGVSVCEEIVGFKTYLEVAEKERIDFANAPEKNPATFEYLLPYAMIFGVEEAWATKFNDMYTTKDSPKWYRGESGATNPLLLAGTMSTFGAHTASAFTNSGGGSGGGGSSGGGGGGGGGGSW